MTFIEIVGNYKHFMLISNANTHVLWEYLQYLFCHDVILSWQYLKMKLFKDCLNPWRFECWHLLFLGKSELSAQLG